MKAIQVKFMPATDNRGSQYKAFIKGNSVVSPCWQHDRDIEEHNCQDVSMMLMDKLGWSDTAEISGGGSIANGDYVFTITNKLK